MRRVVWAAVTILLMLLAYEAGRISVEFRLVPEIVATLPGEEHEFSHELHDRVRERFPVGTSEDPLVDMLTSEGFAPEWRRHSNANAASFVWNGLLCSKLARVVWRADATGALTDVRAAYESRCF